MATAGSITISLLAATGSFETSMERAQKKVRDADSSLKGLDASAKRSSAAMESLGAMAVRVGAVLGAAFSVRAITQYADAWSDMRSTVGAAVKDMQAAPELMRRMVDIANASYSPLQQTVELYTRNVTVLRELGRSSADAADFTESLNNMLVITATRGQRAASVQDALSKAMAVGRLQADGLETVLANGGRVAEALAQALGTSVNGLRDMASQGKITSDVIAGALIDSLDKVRAEAAEMPATIGDAFTRIQTNITEFIGRMDQASGVSSAVAEGLLSFADGIRTTTSYMVAFGQVAAPAFDAVGAAISGIAGYADIALVAVAGFASPALIAGVWALSAALVTGLAGGIKAITAAMLANPIGLLVGALAAGVYAAYKFRDDIQEAIGVDVVDVFKTSANFVIGSFVGAYDNIKFVWNNFGDMMGAAVIGGVNIAIRAINSLIQKATEGVNGLVALINKIPGVDVGSIGKSLGINEIANPYANRLGASFSQLNERAAIAMNRDYIGALGERFKALRTAAQAEDEFRKATEAAGKATGGTTKATGAATKAQQEFERERRSALVAQYQSISAIHAQAQGIEDQVALFGLSRSALEDLTIARLEEEAVVLRMYGDRSKAAVEAIEAEIEARKRLRTAIGSLEQKEAEKAAWQSWSRDVEQIFQQVGQSLTDALFEGGRSGRDLIKDLFKTLTLRVFVQPVMNQMQGWVTNQLGGLFGVQNPAQGGGMFGLAQNVSSLHSAFTGGFTDTLASGINWLGEQFGSSALQSFAAGVKGTATLVSTTLGPATMVPGLGVGIGGGAAVGGGVVTGSAGLVPGLGVGTGGGAAAAGGTLSGASSGAAGFGTFAAKALPWIGGALAIGSAFGLFDDRLPTTRRSQQGASHMLPDGSWEVSSWDDRQDTASQIAARDFAQAAVKHANDLFERIGIDAQIHSFQTLMESSILGDKQGVGSSGQVRIGDVIRDIGLTVESSWTRHGFGGWSDAPMLPRLQTDIQLTILEAFQAAGDQLPSVLSSMLADVDIRSLGAEQAQALAQSFQMVVDQVSALQVAVEQLPFEQLRDLSFDAAANLIQFAGGLEALDAGMTAYFQNFYSEAERLDWLSKQVSGSLSELGLVMPDVTQGADEAKSAWRAIVESLDVTTEEGQRAYATMMTLSGSFAQLVTGMDQLSDATQRAHQELLNSLMGDVNAALSAVQQRGQERIAKLSESFARTDAVFNAYRSQVQQLESQWGSLISTMDRSMRDLRGRVDASARLQYDQARAVISTALLTGQMPQTADLGEAIRIAQQGVTGGRYASAFDQREAYLKLANELEALQGIAKPELDAAQASLEQLEKQYNRLRGIEDLSGLSLKQLEKQLGVALSAEEAARTQIAQIERQISMAQLQYQQLVGINQELSTLPAALNALAKAIESARAVQEAAGPSLGDRATRYLADNPDVLNAYLQGYGKGQSAAEFALEHYERYGRYEGRAFARGGYYSGGLALVGEEGPELINFARPGQVYRADQTQDILRQLNRPQGGSSRETEQLLREQLAEVRQQNRYLYEIVKSGKRNERNTEDVAMAIAHNPSGDVVVVF